MKTASLNTLSSKEYIADSYTCVHEMRLIRILRIVNQFVATYYGMLNFLNENLHSLHQIIGL